MVYFQNAVFFKVDKDENSSVMIGRKDVFKALKKIDNKAAESIDFISQFNTNKMWVITFKNNFNCKQIIGSKIIIDSVCYEIEKMEEVSTNNDPFRTAIYRLLWLPHGYDLEIIKSYLKKVSNVYKVEKIEYETCSDVEMRHIKNGNIRFKIKFKLSQEKNIGLYPGIIEINGYRVLLSKIGERKCYLCNSVDHFKKDCPKASQKCKKCNLIGHLESECTMANRIKDNNDLINLPDEQNEETVSAEGSNDSNGQLQDKSTQSKSASAGSLSNEKSNKSVKEINGLESSNIGQNIIENRSTTATSISSTLNSTATKRVKQHNEIVDQNDKIETIGQILESEQAARNKRSYGQLNKSDGSNMSPETKKMHDDGNSDNDDDDNDDEDSNDDEDVNGEKDDSKTS